MAEGVGYGDCAELRVEGLLFKPIELRRLVYGGRGCRETLIAGNISIAFPKGGMVSCLFRMPTQPAMRSTDNAESQHSLPVSLSFMSQFVSRTLRRGGATSQ